MLLVACGGELHGTPLTLSAPVGRGSGPGQCGSCSRRSLVELRRTRSDHAGRFLTGCLVRHILERSDGPGCLPAIRRPTGNCLHVVLRLIGQPAFPRQPILNSPGAGVVSSSCKAKIAELSYEIA